MSKESSLLHASQPSRSLSINTNLALITICRLEDMWLNSVVKHWLIYFPVTCFSLSPWFNGGWCWSHPSHPYHGSSDYANCSPCFSIDSYFSWAIESAGILGPQTSLMVSNRIVLATALAKYCSFSQNVQRCHWQISILEKLTVIGTEWVAAVAVFPILCLLFVGFFAFKSFTTRPRQVTAFVILVALESSTLAKGTLGLVAEDEGFSRAGFFGLLCPLHN